MGLNNFILTCERESKELKKDLEYYKNQNARLKKQLLITENGFKASTDELCEYAKENQELKSQLEEINKMIEKCGFVNIEQVMLNYCGLLSQQKEFIKYLEDLIKLKSLNATCMFEYNDTVLPLKEILQKYRSIIGSDSNE